MGLEASVEVLVCEVAAGALACVTGAVAADEADDDDGDAAINARSRAEAAASLSLADAVVDSTATDVVGAGVGAAAKDVVAAVEGSVCAGARVAAAMYVTMTKIAIVPSFTAALLS